MADGEVSPSAGRLDTMLSRWAHVLIAALFALGVFAGLGETYATASPASDHCFSQANAHGVTGPASPMRGCDSGPTHTTCVIHASCVAFALPLPVVMQINMRAAGWHVAQPSGLQGTPLTPATPPPILLL